MATVRYFASLKKFKVAHYRTGRHHPGVRSVESNNLRIKKEGAPNRERFLVQPPAIKTGPEHCNFGWAE